MSHYQNGLIEYQIYRGTYTIYYIFGRPIVNDFIKHYFKEKMIWEISNDTTILIFFKEKLRKIH